MANRFSDQHGYTSTTPPFQREMVDTELRIRLWNVLTVYIWNQYPQHGNQQLRYDGMFVRLWKDYLNRDLDQMPPYHADYYNGPTSYLSFKGYFNSCIWYDVFNLLTHLSYDDSGIFTPGIRTAINAALEKHNSAYRFVGKEIMEVTDKQEIVAIETALVDAAQTVRTHLEASLRMLSDREAPDYRNSVKESISAVEAACRLVADSPNATLKEALKKIKGEVHPAMYQAFDKLYGYTSDASGIRHALSEESSITYADAKFMLVACSAFISYLKLSAIP